MKNWFSAALVLSVSACYGSGNTGESKSAEWGKEWDGAMQSKQYYVGAANVSGWNGKDWEGKEWDFYVEIDFDSNGSPAMNVKNSDAVHKCEHIPAQNFSWNGREWSSSWASASGWEYNVNIAPDEGSVGVQVNITPPDADYSYHVNGVAVEAGKTTPPGDENMSYISSKRVANRFGSGDNCGGSESSEWGNAGNSYP